MKDTFFSLRTTVSEILLTIKNLLRSMFVYSTYTASGMLRHVTVRLPRARAGSRWRRALTVTKCICEHVSEGDESVQFSFTNYTDYIRLAQQY